MIRILTYNVHRCLGTDRRLDVGRIAAVIAAETPDIVALQEVDVGRARTGGVDQAHQIAQRLNMTARFHAALKVEEELYGDAILTALPERLIRADALPGYDRIPQLEPRGALMAAIDLGGGAEVRVINTHLGLVPREQQLQAEALAGEGWLGAPAAGEAVILLGDMNATARASAYQRLAAKLTDAHRTPGGRCQRIATFPAALPFLRIDHIFVSEGVEVKSLRVSASAEAVVASDHRPLVMDFALR